jgi:hypothetical protein
MSCITNASKEERHRPVLFAEFVDSIVKKGGNFIVADGVIFNRWSPGFAVRRGLWYN